MHGRFGPAAVVLGCALPAALLCAVILNGVMPLPLAMRALLWPVPLSLPDLVVHDAMLPRILTCWTAGAGLAVAATLLQHALRNPLGSPTTFGVSAGGGLAVALCLLLAPGIIAWDRPAVSLAGAALATGAVLLMARRQRLSPESLAVAGLLVTLCCGAAMTSLALLQGQALGALAIWGAGSLDQRGWLSLRLMLLHAAPAALAVLLIRPLEVMRLDDAGVRSLGLSPGTVRLAAIAAAVWLSAAIVGTVGMVGFVDLAAASCVRLAGARRLRTQLLWAAPAGGAMLWLADGLAQMLARLGEMPLPTGAVTALAGAPILVLLVRRERALSPPEPATPATGGARRHPWRVAACLLLALIGLTTVSACLGHGPAGWRWSTGEELSMLLPWRLPRIGAALGAGICLALAGVLVQALMANPMASPELLGVGPAASIAGVAAILLVPEAGRAGQLMAGMAGAAAALLALLAVARRGGLAPSRLVLLGIGLAAMLGAALNLAIALMPLEIGVVLAWVSGSTYHVTAIDAAATGILAVAGLCVAPLASRWLQALPLGDGTAAAVGVDLKRARLSLALLAALLSAGGTLIVGPFAFVGLMAPHIARRAGGRRPLPRLALTALAGGTLLVAADFLGRNVFFPYQMPAGSMATFLGLIPMSWLLFRR